MTDVSKLFRYDPEEDRHYIIPEENKVSYALPALITPEEVRENPTDPYRIIPILEEFRRAWEKNPEESFIRTLVRIVAIEDVVIDARLITDDLFINAIGKYIEKEKS